MVNILLLIGIAVLLGFIGGKYIERVKSPQVVGFILMGFILGSLGLKIFDTAPIALVEQLDIISYVALAFIGFDVGGEMTIKLFKKLGKSIVVITILEALGAFILVASAVFLYTKQMPTALIFGGLACATAPAATVLVLREYKASGPLTSTLFAVVALDDAIAIILYSFASAFSKNFIENGSISFSKIAIIPAKEIFGSLVLGLLIGAVFSRVVLRMHDPNELIIVAFGAILVCSGLALQYGFSLILANMALGMTLVNLLHGDKTAFNSVMQMAPPIYIIFFFLVGARLQISSFSQIHLWGLMLIYIAFRISGKMLGSFIGARLSGAEENIQKYLGLCLLPQGGVAVGLSIQALQEFSAFPSGRELGLLAVTVIAATTFVLELIGPPSTRYAIIKAGESNVEKY
ncbi:MAG: cation:proton antiporter [Candidatus Hydrothermarchaeales archaeon]